MTIKKQNLKQFFALENISKLYFKKIYLNMGFKIININA